MPHDAPDHDVHDHHEAISKRLRRADGHLQSVIQMIHDKRDCLEIAQQLHAVEKAIVQAKKTLIQDHLDHCLAEAIGSVSREQRGPIDSFKALTKYL